MTINNLQIITELVLEYLNLEKGIKIDKWQEKIKIFDNVFISRRALKHFIERRKEELEKAHDRVQLIYMIFFAINHLKEVITLYDKHEITEDMKISFRKDYSHYGMPDLKVVTEAINSNLDIISIHFSKNKKHK